MPVLSDVHSVEQLEPASEVLDMLQIPAFLLPADGWSTVRQRRASVNVKKGQFLAPEDMYNVLQKMRSQQRSLA